MVLIQYMFFFIDEIENKMIFIFIQTELFVHTIPHLGEFLVGCESFYFLALKVRGGGQKFEVLDIL